MLHFEFEDHLYFQPRQPFWFWWERLW